MKRISIYSGLSILLLLSVLSACSKDKSDQATSADAAKPSSTQSAPAQHLQGQVPSSGKVVKAMHAGGYTYMELENSGKVFWIAATMMNVKRDDNVAWGDAAVMRNFKSPSLRRTFDEILFVSNAKVQ